MIEYRAFRNSDPPALAAAWPTIAQRRGWVQPMSANLLESHVLSKPYFDNAGLIVAVHGEERIGFAHVGFGPSADRMQLDHEVGVVSMLLVRHDRWHQGIGGQLLTLGEDYLKSRGARLLWVGGTPQVNPFYLGLYGGSQLPGVLDSDPESQGFFQRRGYAPAGTRIILHLDLGRFRPLIDRNQIQIRRMTQVDVTHDPTPRDWWEACTHGAFDRLRCELRCRADGAIWGSVTAWHMDPFSTAWGVRAAGAVDLIVDPSQRRKGIATFLLAELFNRLKQDNVHLVELQCDVANESVHKLALKLGFHEVDRGLLLSKTV